MERVLDIFIHAVLLLLMPPLLNGIINKTKAFFAGRRGRPLFQQYFDLIKLARKEVIISRSTTWIFSAAPAVSLTVVLMAGFMLPFGPFPSPVSFSGDVILFAYLLALGRFFTTAAALDTGSAFEGMGAAREVSFAFLSEAAFFFTLLLLVKMSGSLTLENMMHAPLSRGTGNAAASLVLASVGIFILLLAENSRIPVDDPNTHLELTMIHEVMVLDHSGPLLGMIQYGASLKLFVFAAFLLHFVFPFQTGSLPLDWGLFVVEMMGAAVGIGLVESVMARLQMRHVPYLLIAAILFCGFAFILFVRQF